MPKCLAHSIESMTNLLPCRVQWGPRTGSNIRRWYKDINTHQAFKCSISVHSGDSLVVQWLRVCAPNAGGPGSISGQGTRSRMLQLKIPHAAMKIPHTATKVPHATTKTQHIQINK